MAAALSLATACAPPAFTYVSDRDHRTVFRVPATWDELDRTALSEVLFGTTAEDLAANGGWVVGYDAAPSPAVSHVATATLEHPVAYLAVLRRGDGATALSDDQLRDFIHPVTQQARSTALAEMSPGAFALLADERVLRPKGIHGVHVVYRYGTSGRSIVFDQTTLTNSESSWVYAMLVQCSPQCRARESAAISAVVDSFTVRR